jgi:peptide/nickel transport system permease protein
MARYIGGRVIQLIVIIFFISVVAFMMVHLLPGNPTTSILGPNDTAQAQALLLKQLGLNKPLPLQYWTWISNVFHGNLGVSFLTHQTVANAIGEAFPIDLELIIVSQLIAFIVAIPLALVAALRPNRLFDRIATTSTYAMLAVPTFVVAVILVLLVAVKIHIFPATGFNPLGQGIGPNLKSVLLPSIALAVGSVAIYYRLLRADMIATLQEDFITMARAKGLSTTYILLRHALRPSSFALLAGAGLSIGSLFTGAFVVEILFQLPGIGFQLIAAIN